MDKNKTDESLNTRTNIIKQAFQLSKNKIMKVGSCILGLFSVVSGICGFDIVDGFLEKLLIGVFCIVVIACVAYLVIIVVRNEHIVIQGGDPQNILNSTIQFYNGSFVDGMQSIIENDSLELNDWNFISGIDRSMKLDQSTTKGILRALFYGDNEENLSKEGFLSKYREHIQESINKKIEVESISRDAKGNVPYGTCITIPVTMDVSQKRFYMTFIANSEHIFPNMNQETEKENFDEIVMRITTDELMKKLFQRIKEIGPSHHMMGAIGTGGLKVKEDGTYGLPYQEIINFIITYYYDIIINTSRKRKLIISVREDDYQKYGLNFADLQQYITVSANFLNKYRKG